MLWRMKSWLRRLRTAMQPMRERGWGPASIALRQVPAAFFWRAWRSLAQRLDGGWLQKACNEQRFSAFQDRLPASALPRFYVIVMPNTLHFLLPCLAQLQGRAQIVLLFNGARGWERRRLLQRWPDLPHFRLRTLPLASIAHGHVINLLLEQHRGNFGIIDHDCYVLDDSLFAQLTPAPDECLLSLFGEASGTLDFTFPLTFFLFFNAEALRRLMHSHRVDARLYRQDPPGAQAALRQIGLGPGRYWKRYHNFRDTLHVLLAVALAAGQKIRFLAPAEDEPALHIGGTSIGTHHAKELPALYFHLRFLELLDDPVLNRRYAFMAAPLRSSAEALARMDVNQQAELDLVGIESMMARLRERLDARRAQG